MSARRLRAAAVVLLAGLAVAACGGLPNAGPVQQGLDVGAPAVEPVRVLPNGPTPGAPPAEIVRGFLAAGNGVDDDHAIARSFFAPSIAASWEPDRGVMVYPDADALTFRTGADHTVLVTAQVTASIDASGRYRELPPGTQVSATFGLQQVNSQWRIAALQKDFGLWLTSFDLARLYRPFTINYVSPVERSVVPDRRWFPLGPGLATTLARAQLDPVPDYLRGAAVTGVPPGTRLAVDAVPVENGRAIVDLSAAGLVPDSTARRAMWAQFIATLTQVPAVRQVSLEVEGSRLDLPDVPDAASSPVDVGFPAESTSTQQALVRSGSTLQRVDPTRFGDVEQPRRAPSLSNAPLPVVAPGWTGLAVSPDSSEVAAIGGDHRDMARWQGLKLTQLPRFADHLTRPSYDGLHGLWVAGHTAGASRVYWIDTSAPVAAAAPRPVTATWLAGRAVIAFRVAPDDERALVVSTRPGGTDLRVDVVGIVRAANDQPQALTPPLRVAPALTSATDAAWVDEGSLVVLGRQDPSDAMRPYLCDVGGVTTPLTPVPGERSVTTSGGPRGVVVVTDQGQVLQRAGTGWVAIGKGTDFAVPGA